MVSKAGIRFLDAMRRVLLIAGLASALTATSGAQTHEHSGTSDSVSVGLGTAHFANSGAPAAQADFLRGLLLLHSFEYPAARSAFQAAEQSDPTFVVAYCGEALSYNQTLWGEQNVPAARAALVKLAPTPAERAAKAKTPRERAYVEAVDQLFGEGTKTERDARYSAALGALSRQYPDDLDARALYALSILGLTNGVRNIANYMRAAAEAEAVYEVDHNHPGALHYLIHAYDDPIHAPLGLRAANLYGRVAPAASHALHMPSHIYFALGMWDEAIAANTASLQVAHAQRENGYHSLVWLAYAHLQEGHRADAEALIRSVAHDVETTPGKDNRIRLAHLHAIWLVETQGAGLPDQFTHIDAEGIASIGYFDTDDFAVGIAPGARDSERRAALARIRARAQAARSGAGIVKADWHDNVTAAELAQAGIMADALEGAIKCGDGNLSAGLAQVRAAIAKADGEEFEYGPPWSVKPLDELLGDLLLAAGQRADAALAYGRALSQYPNRRLAREGLLAARSAP